jgi:MFS family permease
VPERGRGLQVYRSVLGIREVRRILWLSLVIRIPMWAANVILTLHVVTHLHRSYGAAGLLTGAVTVALSVSAPWRGRRLDRVGLRGTVAPSLVILAACWSVAPFVGYWPLLMLASFAGLFLVPSFSIVRQVLMHTTAEDQRKTALSIDSVMVEISFMIGPPIGVLLATYFPTSWVLFACEFATIGGGIALWIADPPLRAAEPPGVERDHGPTPGVRSWLSVPLFAVLMMAAATTLVLTATDVGVVAALRDMGHQSWIGWELAVWGVGSAVGGLVYGALHRTVPVAALLALLAGTTIPVILAAEPFLLAALLFVTGLFCAPTITATVDALSRVVPERVRGEALGWHGSAMTAGSAIGAPVAGVAIDKVGWHGGFVLPGLLGLAAALGGLTLIRQRAGIPPPAVAGADLLGR